MWSRRTRVLIVGITFARPDFWRKPIRLRCGYVAGWNLEREHGPTQDVRKYQKREAWALNAASRVNNHTRTSGMGNEEIRSAGR